MVSQTLSTLLQFPLTINKLVEIPAKVKFRSSSQVKSVLFIMSINKL